MAETFRPKIFAFCCQRSSPEDTQGESTPLVYEDADVTIKLLDCSEKLKLNNLVEPFMEEASGIFTSGCSVEKCHFKTGNLQAESKVILGKQILQHSAINPDRLVFYNLPPGGNEQFNTTIQGFINIIKSLGPLGSSEKVDAEILQLKLKAALQAVEGKKFNWIISRPYQFMDKGNRYGELFTNHEIHRMLDDIVMDECRLQQILLLLQKGPQSVVDISEKLTILFPQTLLHLTDLKRMGMVKIGKVKGDIPLWQAVGS